MFHIELIYWVFLNEEDCQKKSKLNLSTVCVFACNLCELKSFEKAIKKVLKKGQWKLARAASSWINVREARTGKEEEKPPAGCNDPIRISSSSCSSSSNSNRSKSRWLCNSRRLRPRFSSNRRSSSWARSFPSSSSSPPSRGSASTRLAARLPSKEVSFAGKIGKFRYITCVGGYTPLFRKTNQTMCKKM